MGHELLGFTYIFILPKYVFIFFFLVLSNVTDFRVINVAQNDVVQGTEVTLSCTATVGKPSSNIELLKGTNVLNSSMTSATSSMTVFYNFKNITKEDSGEYICEVKTTNGYVSRKVLQLSVKCK